MLRPALLGCVVCCWASTALALCPGGYDVYYSRGFHNGEEVDLVTCTNIVPMNDGVKIEEWMIRKPDVMQATTQYPIIRFNVNDRVTVKNASGCVQTGGWGLTWKRYVDPDFGTTSMYRGMIQLPGRPQQTLASLLAQGPVVITVSGSLTLGYVDDDYEDNGYYPYYYFDVGTGNQCASPNSHEAYFELYIEHPRCDGIVCGPSRNGLGMCPNTCAPAFPSCTPQQTCCAPACSGRACNDSDGCGGTCGCPGGQDCQGNQCVCVPDCSGACGSADGCGGTCAVGSGCIEKVPTDPPDPVCPKAWLCSP